MSRYPNKSVKRKIEECQDDENGGGRAAKEVKKELAYEEGPSFGNDLRLLRLSPEDWAPVAASCIQDDDGDSNVEEDSGQGSVSRGTSWTGSDASRQIHGSSSQLSVACKRFANGSSSFDCETQTYYFLPKSADEASSAGNVSQDRGEKAANVKDHDSLVRVCCVIDCDSQLSERDSSVKYYGLPSSNTERSLWGEILGVVFADVPEETTQEICSKHFVASASSPDVRKSSPVPKSSRAPKAKTRKKRTCDILIAEEAEKVKQSMTTGRTKRTPKPNRNYDWAELIPLIKSEGDDLEDIEIPVTKTPAKHPGVPGRRRKQPLDDIKKEEKENERPYMEVHIGVCNEAGIPDLEAEDYGANISLPSVPRAPPPKPKGRPHRIQDTCTQTDTGLCISRGPLREVKVQCNLTAEPLITCSSCSSIDWRRLDEQLSSVMSIIEGGLCNPVLARSLKKIIADITKPSHASNVLKMIAGIERDLLESGKDIILVSGQDDLEEVEIDNVIHQEEAPMTGMREITPKLWNKKTKVAKEGRVKAEEISYEDPDSLGLKEATDKDDEEFQPEYAALEEEEEDDDLEELDDDDDWDIRNEDESGVPIPRKKKPPRQRMRKGTGRRSPPGAVKLHTSDNVQPKSKVSGREGCIKSFQCVDSCDDDEPQSFPGSKPIFQCDECGKQFTQRQAVRYHKIWRHNAERLGPCPYCSYKAPDATKLKVHIKKVHHGYMPYKCKFCSKRFKCHSNHKEHETRHQGTGNFKCKFCDKKFAILSTLERHERYHFGKRPFVCNYCEKGFKAKPHLERHVKCIHLKEKNIFCKLCGKAHFNNWNLKMHMKTHEVSQEGIVRSCNICNCKFKNNTGLAAHMRKQHNVTSVYFEEPKMDVATQHTEATREDGHKLLSTALAVSTSDTFAMTNYGEDDCQGLGSQSSSVEAEEEVTAHISTSGTSEHRTIVIQDGSICNNQCESKEEESLAYTDFLEDSSMHTFELYTCNGCSGVFESKEEYLTHV